MPGGDRTGPMGAGPMTGRGAGYCAGYGMPGYANPIPGRGFRFGGGRGGGFGRGFRGGFRHWGTPYPAAFPAWGYPYGQTATPSRRDELNDLKEQARYLKDMLADINSRIDALTDKQEG